MFSSKRQPEPQPTDTTRDCELGLYLRTLFEEDFREVLCFPFKSREGTRERCSVFFHDQHAIILVMRTAGGKKTVESAVFSFTYQPKTSTAYSYLRDGHWRDYGEKVWIGANFGSADLKYTLRGLRAHGEFTEHPRVVLLTDTQDGCAHERDKLQQKRYELLPVEVRRLVLF